MYEKTERYMAYGTGYVPTAPQMESAESVDMPPPMTNAAASVMGPTPEPPDVSAMVVTSEGYEDDIKPSANGTQLPPLVPPPKTDDGMGKILFIGLVAIGLYWLAG